MFGDGLDADGDIARAKVDGRRAVGFGEAEKRIGHEVLRVAGREIAGERAEQLKLLAFGSGAVARGHGRGCRAASAARLVGEGRQEVGMALGGKHLAGAGIGGRSARAPFDPGL